MKSLKKTLALLVVFSMVLSTFVTAFADVTDVAGLDCEEEVTRLVALDVVKGYEDGTYGPEKTITRAEMAVILCKMVGISSVTVDENKNVPSKFSDVAAGEWYTGYINVAAGKGLLSGFPDGTFRPNEQLTMNQVLTLCVNALGRGEYVSTMGTWPANYIAEATKLGLLDGVKTSDANRGNVAIICWNTLVAPYVWDVTTTEYEGTINLGNSTRSLLSIYFRDFTCDDTTKHIENGLLKEAEYVKVIAVPSSNGTTEELGDNQFIVIASDDTDDADYADLLDAIDETKKPRGTDDEEWTSTTVVNTEDAIVAYAPDVTNIDSLLGKVVTVIFGKDNKVASIRVIDETAESNSAVAYEDEKLKIDGTTYKFADDAEVYVNNVEMTSSTVDADKAMTNIATILNIDFAEKYNKAIKTSIVKNTKGKISRLDMFVSGTYPEFKTVEAIATKVKNDVITLKTLATTNFEDIDYSEDGEYEDEQPRVIKDGEVIGLEDIEAGDVLTMYVGDMTKANSIKTILVSRTTKEGTIDRTSKKDFRLTIGGTAYFASTGEKDSKFLFTEEKLTDIKTATDADAYRDEDATLYLNIYGEYALLLSDKDVTDWTFGIVTRVDDTEDDADDDDLYYITTKILLADNTVSRDYKFVYDDGEDDDTVDTWEDAVAGLKDKFIVFGANSNKEIEYGNFGKVTVANLSNDDKNVTNKDFFAVAADAGNDVDDDYSTIEANGGNEYTFKSSSVIFNTGAGDKATVSTKFDNIVEDDELKFATIIVYEKDSKKISYVLIDQKEDDYAASNALYAVVADDDEVEYKSGDKQYSKLIVAGETAVSEIETKKTDRNYVDGMEGMLIEYKLSASKLEEVAKLIDLPGFKKLKATATVNDEVASSKDTKLVVDFGNVTYVKDNTNGTITVIENTEEVDTVAEDGEVRLATITDLAPTSVPAAYVTPVAGDYAKLVESTDAIPANYTRTKSDATVNATEANADGKVYVVAAADNFASGEISVATIKAANDAAFDATEDDSYILTVEVGNKVIYHAAVAAYDERYEVCTESDDGALLVIANKETVDTVAAEGQMRAEDAIAAGATGVVAGDKIKVATGVARTKDNFKVVEIDVDSYTLTYADDEDGVENTFGEIKLDKDVEVYDARNGVIEATTLKNLAEDKDVYVIPYADSEADDGRANILFIVK